MFRFRTMFRSISVFRTAVSDVSDVKEIEMFRTATVNRTPDCSEQIADTDPCNCVCMYL